MNSRAWLSRICLHEVQVHLGRWNHLEERLFDTRSPPVEHYLGLKNRRRKRRQFCSVYLQVETSSRNDTIILCNLIIQLYAYDLFLDTAEFYASLSSLTIYKEAEMEKLQPRQNHASSL
jgi:hypothetical protein